MNWWERAISYVVTGLSDPVVIVVGATILTLIVILAVLYFESKIRKDRNE